MLSWDFGIPMIIVVSLIAFAWFSFLSVVLFG